MRYENYKKYFMKIFCDIYKEIEKNGEALRNVSDIERAMGLNPRWFQSTVNGFKYVGILSGFFVYHKIIGNIRYIQWTELSSEPYTYIPDSPRSLETIPESLLDIRRKDNTADYWEQKFREKRILCLKNRNEYLIDFKGINWENIEQGVRHKAFIRDNQRIRLVEFSDEFAEKDWCSKGHIGYILEGRLSIDFNGKQVNFESGDGLFIPEGEANKHKGRVSKGEKALCILVEKV